MEGADAVPCAMTCAACRFEEKFVDLTHGQNSLQKLVVQEYKSGTMPTSSPVGKFESCLCAASLRKTARGEERVAWIHQHLQKQSTNIPKNRPRKEEV